MSDDLKPCPFCGGCADVYDSVVGIYVYCSACSAHGPAARAGEAIQLWNTRSREEALEADLARADITETQLHAALEREQALREWALEAIPKLWHLQIGFNSAYDWERGRAIEDLINRCPAKPTEGENHP